MRQRPPWEQQIAVFGESGSGKTVLLSSFYGAAQEAEFRAKSMFDLLAMKTADGYSLHKAYLGMRDSARVPGATRFAANSYGFSLRLRSGISAGSKKPKQSELMRLVWHDYPGEWFEQDASGPEEAERRVDAFRNLLGSDVALLLVDGQKMLDYSGEEDRYLKSMLTGISNGLLALTDDLLVGGKPLAQFPRIWVLALSKADLLPNLDVYAFRDTLVTNASDEIEELRRVLAGLVQGSDALSVGQDFVLLSSAKFTPGKIEVTERIGLDLILPLAAGLPLERHVRWAKARNQLGKVGENLLGAALGLATALGGAGALAAKLGKGNKIAAGIGLAVGQLGSTVEHLVGLAGDGLRAANARALAKHDYLTALTTDLLAGLEQGEEQNILIKGR
ncbi:MAG: ATP/GTP-binding protein [Actinobacteria bacterium]|nr:ATP/GTP-binding protein [Actinomycetota bacterium]